MQFSLSHGSSEVGLVEFVNGREVSCVEVFDAVSKAERCDLLPHSVAMRLEKHTLHSWFLWVTNSPFFPHEPTMHRGFSITECTMRHPHSVWVSRFNSVASFSVRIVRPLCSPLSWPKGLRLN